jgi:protein SCO1/2
MNRFIRLLPPVAAAVLIALATNVTALGQGDAGRLVQAVGFDQKLGVQLPLELPFRDESGREIRLGELFGRRPVILVPVYYRCPMLCNQLLIGLTRSLKPVSLSTGKDFDLIAFSIDPEEQPDVARQKRTGYLERYDRPGTDAGWHFLTGPKTSIDALTQSIGFRYTFNAETKLYTHAAGVVIATPDGKVARYFYGIDFPPRELQDELALAAKGKIGSKIGRLLLLCYDYDSATGKYTLSILRIMRIIGTATAVILGCFVFFLFRREGRQRSVNDRWDGLAEGAIPSVSPPFTR